MKALTVDARSMIAGLPLGPLLVLVGYLGLAKLDVTISDTMLVVVVVFPTVLLMSTAVVAAIRRRRVVGWVSMAIGATVGTVALAVIVLGGISLLAMMISDPG